MSTEPGSEFSIWEGDIVGKNLEFEENKLLKQHWYFEGEPEESIVTIQINKKTVFFKSASSCGRSRPVEFCC